MPEVHVEQVARIARRVAVEAVAHPPLLAPDHQVGADIAAIAQVGGSDGCGGDRAGTGDLRQEVSR